MPGVDNQSADHFVSEKTILVVDDDQEILELVSNYLCTLGYTVLTAESGAEGISASETHPGPIHLLITDVEMPEMTGVELAQYFLSRREVPVIFTSGFGEAHNLDPLPGQIEYLPKPFSLAELANKISSLISCK